MKYLCRKCLGCNKLMEREFEGVDRCINFAGEIEYEEYLEEVKKDGGERKGKVLQKRR